MEQQQLDTITGWFTGRLPDDWFTGPPTVSFEEGQVRVVGALTPPALATGTAAGVTAGAEAGRIARFREETRRERVWIAREAEHGFDVLIQWGATCGGTTTQFTPGGSGRSRRKSDKSDESDQGEGGARQVEI